MIDGLNDYRIPGIPEDAFLKEVQGAWRKFVKDNHEDVVSPHERQAAKEKMFRINEAYEVLSHEDKRTDYDNAYLLNGGSKIELVRSRVRRAEDIILRDRSLMTREEITLIESILDYLDKHTQQICFDWITDILCKHPEMTSHMVSPAFDEQLLGATSHLLDTLLEKAPFAMTWDKIYLYAEDILGIGKKEDKERNYNQLARILCHRLDLARHFVYPAFQEQASGCESCLLQHS